jgi:hypothetical protein
MHWSFLLAVFTLSALIAPDSCARAEAPDTTSDGAPLEARLEAIERRQALADRKLRLLAAESEAELVCGVDLFREPRLLLEQAKLALGREEEELAYRFLALLQALHPDSPEAADSFLTATALFRSAYFRNRLVDERSIWVLSEPYFLYQWLARHWGDEDPREKLEALFLGMPFNVFDNFRTFASRHPNIVHWRFEATKDNGIVQTITVEPPAAGVGRR